MLGAPSTPPLSMWFLRVLSSIAFLFSTVVLIPLAFDVGGRTCGLAFSLLLSTFYSIYSILRVTTPPRSRIRWLLIKLLGVLQWFFMPALLIWCLNRYSVDAEGSGGWVERTFGGKRAAHKSVIEWLFGYSGLVETVSLGSWDKFLRWSIPVFQLCEGFCSLLVIQAAGQISRWLVNRSRGDTWMVRPSGQSTSAERISADGCSGRRLYYWSCPPRSSRARSTSYGGSSNSRESAMSMRP